MRGLAVTAEMTIRDLLGRRTVVVLLVVVPLVFYAARRDDFQGQAIRFASLGLAWAVSTVALFATNSVRPLEPRLRLAGHGSAGLYLGRLTSTVGLGAFVAALYAVLVTLDQETVHPWSAVLALLASGTIAAALGVLVGAVVPRELEGMLVLITIVGLQMIVDPTKALAEALPLWSTRELVAHAVDGVGDVDAAIVHWLGYGLGMSLVALAITVVRLRRRRHVVYVDAQPNA
jgi:hypothetical protein